MSQDGERSPSGDHRSRRSQDTSKIAIKQDFKVRILRAWEYLRLVQRFRNIIKMFGDSHRFTKDNGNLVTNIVIYHEDEIVINNGTLLMTQVGGQMMDQTNKRLLDCRPNQEECTFDGTVYIWKNAQPTCSLFETK